MIQKIFISLSFLALSLFSAQAATVDGVVSATVGGAAISGAIVTLTPVAGGGTTYTATTNATGNFSMTTVDAGFYDITAAAAGYTTSTAAAVNVANATSTVTHNITLAVKPAGIKITGTVTDTTTGTPLAGAIVRLRTGNGLNITVVDSVVTAANGTYTLDSVQTGTYSINVTAAGHTAKTETGIIAATTNLTSNFQLVGLPAGIKISGTVTNATSGIPIAGALIRLRNGGVAVDSAITAANGTYSIDSVQPATYSIVASATGYTGQTVTGIVVTTTNITRNFQLTLLPGVTISGNVADSVSGNPLSGAVVHLYQGSTLIDTAIVAVNGTYTLSNIQAGTYSITVTAAAHIHKTQSNIVVANAAITLDFLLVAGTDKVLSSGAKNIAQPNFTMSRSGIISLSNITGNGILSITALNGKLVYRTSITGNATSLKLPENIAKTNGVFLVSITQKNLVVQKQWVK